MGIVDTKKLAFPILSLFMGFFCSALLAVFGWFPAAVSPPARRLLLKAVRFVKLSPIYLKS
jgi:hypothetical protein